jgi:hypothetical protein
MDLERCFQKTDLEGYLLSYLAKTHVQADERTFKECVNWVRGKARAGD